MKKIILSYLLLFNFVFGYDSYEKLNLNESLSKEIYETIDILYQNIEELYKSSLYIDVSENKDYELSLMVDNKDIVKSDFVLIGLLYKNTNKSIKDSQLFLIQVNKNKDISLSKEYSLLTKEEFLLKQDTILKLVKEYKDELLKRNKIKTNIKNEFKEKFLKM